MTRHRKAFTPLKTRTPDRKSERLPERHGEGPRFAGSQTDVRKRHRSFLRKSRNPGRDAFRQGRLAAESLELTCPVRRKISNETGFTPLEVRRCFLTGFTLIELMIVVVILGLLATIIMPRILNRPEQARRMKAKVEIRSIESALALFKTDTGRFPTTSEGLKVLVSDQGIKGYNSDAYLDKEPFDPWGNKYIYIYPGVHSRDYDLKSYGKDGEDGGTEDNADIESWNLDE